MNWCMGEPIRKGVIKMATKNLRFTVSVDDDIAIRLDKLKQVKYYNTTRSKMVQDLIALGLETMQKNVDFTKEHSLTQTD